MHSYKCAYLNKKYASSTRTYQIKVNLNTVVVQALTMFL